MRIAPALLLLVAACGRDSDAIEAERRPHFEAFARKFGEAVRKGDHLAAYAMTSKGHYQGSTGLAEFKAILEEAREEYGATTHVGVDFNTLNAEEVGDDLGFPDGVPARDRRARLVIRLQDGPDYNDAVYEIWINVIDEGGESRIVSVEIPGINM